MAMASTRYIELKDQISSELLGASAQARDGGALIVGESTFSNLPAGTTVSLQTISFSRLQSGDYILISHEGRAAVRRFIKLNTSGNSTLLVVADGAGQRQAVPFPRLLGLISGVKSAGEAFNPNPRGFLQRAVFRLRCTLT